MEFQDKVLKCIDCGSDFIFTAGEQLFFHDKQFKNEPKRCKTCKTKRVAVLGAPPAPGQSLSLHQGRDSGHLLGMRKTNTVPFRPTQGRPVFCRECFQSRRTAGFGLIACPCHRMRTSLRGVRYHRVCPDSL